MNYSNIVKEISESQLRTDLPRFNSGDTIRVTVKIKEDKKFRIQAFEGVVIKTQGSGITEVVTVRKNSNGVFVERTLPIHSPIIDKIEVIKHGKVRRAKIYYIRNLSGKAARIQERLPQRANPNAEVKVKKKKSDAKSITAQKALAAHQRRKRKAVDKKIADRINPDKIENKKIQAAKLEAKAKIAKKPSKPPTAKKVVVANKSTATKPSTPKPTTKPVAKSTPKTVAKPTTKTVATPKPAPKKVEATAAAKPGVKKSTGAKKTQGK